MLTSDGKLTNFCKSASEHANLLDVEVFEMTHLVSVTRTVNREKIS